MKVSSFTTKENHTITLGQFTVLIGPNNVGKPQILRDIHSKVVGGQSARTTLVDRFSVEKPESFQDLFRWLQVVDHPTQMGLKLVRGITANLVRGDEVGFNATSVEQEFQRSPDVSFLLRETSFLYPNS